ncbi:hypothetical protein C7N43_09270 [Sphingobacteriales bacterium UPWRP_1]|nr:hypothetical protein B6N25_07935 [Sphingobacteriales bacterium TSM_CSS]PSJ77319.1 hypothetical protein C7N43_09270 [Sphingobacteriales bacterium UPWRP_1]
MVLVLIKPNYIRQLYAFFRRSCFRGYYNTILGKLWFFSKKDAIGELNVFVYGYMVITGKF